MTHVGVALHSLGQWLHFPNGWTVNLIRWNRWVLILTEFFFSFLIFCTPFCGDVQLATKQTSSTLQLHWSQKNSLTSAVHHSTVFHRICCDTMRTNLWSIGSAKTKTLHRVEPRNLVILTVASRLTSLRVNSPCTLSISVGGTTWVWVCMVLVWFLTL